VVAFRHVEPSFGGDLAANVASFPAGCQTASYTAGPGETALLDVAVHHTGSNAAGGLKIATGVGVNGGAVFYRGSRYSFAAYGAGGPFGGLAADASYTDAIPLTDGSAYVFGTGVESNVDQTTGISTCHVTVLIIRQ
jgi:hypothetical protein